LDGTQNLVFRSSGVTGGPAPAGFIVPGVWAPYENESLAVFADMNFNLTDNLSLIAGVRFAQEEINLDQAGGALSPAPPTDTEALGGFRPPGPPGVIVPYNPCQEAFLTDTIFTQDTIDYDVVTPRLGLGYAVSENSNLYATYSEGFKAGGYALRTGCGEEYEEETVSSFEIGSKNVLADGRVRLNATAFYYDYEGYQIEQLVGFVFALTNAEAAEVLGLELESTFLVNNNFSIIANASFQQSEFTDYVATDSLNPQLGEQDVSGNPLPGAPDTTANISFVYELDSGFAFQLGASYKSEINFREFDNDADAQEAYTLWNANIRWESEDDTINARLYANNLTDEEYFQAAFASSLTQNRLGSWGAPRQVGVEVSYNF
jgi:iron complex outermembrane receptor protein